MRSSFVLAALAAAVHLGAPAQVTPSEPFGGRPFGAPPGTPAPAPAVQPAQQQPQQQPQVVVVQPPAAQPQPASPLGTMGAAAPMAPQTQPQQAGPAPGSAGRMPVQNSMSTPAPAVPPAPPPAAAAPPAPAPAPVTPPFNANAARGPASAPAAAPQQPVKGLPADAPKLVISGGVYSADPARRMLIVNGQVVREGADLGSGVVLQEVKAESAVLDYKGTRYTVLF